MAHSSTLAMIENIRYQVQGIYAYHIIVVTTKYIGGLSPDRYQGRVGGSGLGGVCDHIN